MKNIKMMTIICYTIYKKLNPHLQNLTPLRSAIKKKGDGVHRILCHYAF